MNPRNLTREVIEQLNDIEPYCFETDREEQWFNVGLQYGLNIADSDPKSPWISVKDDLPCNHEELLNPDDKRNTSYVVAIIHGYIIMSRMYKLNGKWYWENDEPTYWFPIPKLP